jgi:hypothetical protein
MKTEKPEAKGFVSLPRLPAGKFVVVFPAGYSLRL